MAQRFPQQSGKGSALLPLFVLTAPVPWIETDGASLQHVAPGMRRELRRRKPLPPIGEAIDLRGSRGS